MDNLFELVEEIFEIGRNDYSDAGDGWRDHDRKHVDECAFEARSHDDRDSGVGSTAEHW